VVYLLNTNILYSCSKATPAYSCSSPWAAPSTFYLPTLVFPFQRLPTSKSQAPSLVQAGPTCWVQSPVNLLWCAYHLLRLLWSCLLGAIPSHQPAYSGLPNPRECQPVKDRLRPWYKLTTQALQEIICSSTRNPSATTNQVVSQSSQSYPSLPFQFNFKFGRYRRRHILATSRSDTCKSKWFT
jgi:hypothetical protein